MQELRGKAVADALAVRFKEDIKKLSEKCIVPKLAVIRVGNSEDDIAYEKGIIKKFSEVGAIVEITVLSNEVSQEEMEKAIDGLNKDNSVHGILLYRPLPIHLMEERIKTLIAEDKDVDCMGMANMAYLFSGDLKGYVPCTPQAVIEMLDYYGIDVTGKKVTIVGRSLVVGKPLAMLLLEKNATITICHTRTKNIEKECKTADILIACAGAPKMIVSDFVHSEQIIIDVGINMYHDQLCGDVDYAKVSPIVKAITPVPGGVGTVTTSVLLKHIIKSAVGMG